MAKTDWELALNDGVTHARPNRWRLVAGVISIVAVSSAVGFYLPLYRTEQLMAVEYQRSRALAAELEQRLAENERSLAKVTAEHRVLSEAKQGIDAAQALKHGALERLTTLLSQRLQPALDRQRIRFELRPAQLNIALTDPSLFHPVTGRNDAFRTAAVVHSWKRSEALWEGAHGGSDLCR